MTRQKAPGTIHRVPNDPLHSLRRLITRGRRVHGLTQWQAAEKANVTVDVWVNLERGSQRTGISLPRDRELINGVASALEFDSGDELMREAGLL